MSDRVQRIEKVSCEKGCDKPVDRPRSRVRCAEHYSPPQYGKHEAPPRKNR